MSPDLPRGQKKEVTRIEEELTQRRGRYTRVTDWNDAPERTHADVLELAKFLNI